MIQATNRPWAISMGSKTTICRPADLPQNQRCIIAEMRTNVMGLPISIEEAEANAKLIIKAVNYHDELVEALKGAVRAIEYLSGTTKHSILYNTAKQALAEVESVAK